MNDAQHDSHVRHYVQQRVRQSPRYAKLQAIGHSLARWWVAIESVIRSRAMGHETSDEENITKAGYKDSKEFWHEVLSEPRGAGLYCRFLATFHLTPETDKNELMEESLMNALRVALKTNQTWFIRDPNAPSDDLESLELHPRPATEWLLSMPRFRCLVPETLQAFLEQPREASTENGCAPGPTYRSGTQGRPTSIHLVEAEFHRRRGNGELLATAAGVAES